jgi:hypothetical protein
MPPDFVELVTVHAPVKSVVSTGPVNDDVSVWHLVVHSLAAKIETLEGVDVRDYPPDPEVSENHLWVLAPPRKNEEYNISLLSSCAKIISTNAPCRRGSPKVRVIVNP